MSPRRSLESGGIAGAVMTPGDELEPRIAVELVPLPPTAALEGEWRDLEDRSDGSFFVGWSWIGCWITALDRAVDLRLLRARLDGRTVGLCVLARYRERRHGLITSRTLRLHTTGRAEFDSLLIECNGPLVARGLGAAVERTMFAHLFESDGTWDELVLDGLWSLPDWLANSPAQVRVTASVAHCVALGEVRARNGDYLGLLGAKTRSRIRRSLTEYERIGPCVVQAATDVAQAQAFLVGLKALHQSSWVARGQPGAFASPFFEDFHRRLVSTAFGRGEIQLLAVDAGARRIGYIYNFLYRGRIYNYQSGFDYEVCEKHNRPGLVAHARAIEFNARAGHAIYDFLAGDLEYKQALGTGAGSISWVVVQRERLRFRVEDAARALRRWLRRSPKPAAPQQPAAGAPD